MKKYLIISLIFLMLIGIQMQAQNNMEELTLTTEWDKTFPKSDKVEHCKVIFHNRYGVTLAADLYKPKGAKGKLAAIAVSGPYGAIKEQVSGRYAQTLAERGFLAIAFDPSFTGESSGTPRHLTSPEISTDDFSAAVDYFLTRDDVDYDKIGILGICGWGGFALNAAANDPRIKATVASTMYNMTEVTANGYFNAADDADSRYKIRQQLNEIRTNDYRNGENSFAGSVSGDFAPETPNFVRRYFDYYKNPARGFHHRSPNSTTGMTATSALAYVNMPINTYIDEIRMPVLLVHGSEAHSRYFSEEAFKHLKGDNKELHIVPGADHTDLYDNLEMIPFDMIESFYLKSFEK